MSHLFTKIAAELSVQEFQVNNVIKLLFEEDCTIPFVARYRKERTGALDEVMLRSIRDRFQYLQELETNKEKYLKVIEHHCAQKPELAAKLPELRAKIARCETKQELEDIYLPFKPKRRTRAQIAKEKKLDGLLTAILAGCTTINDLEEVAKGYVTPAGLDLEPAQCVKDVKEALAGASDILADQIAESADFRALERKISFDTGMFVARKAETASAGGASAEAGDGEEKTSADLDKKRTARRSDASTYENYFDYAEPVLKAAPHRVMAVRRGEAEKVLKVTIEVNIDQILVALKNAVVANPQTTDVVRLWQEKCVEDAYKRLLSPSIETEIRLEMKNNAEEEAIKVFSKNIENLLLLPPIPGKTVMGVDPGIRTGSKLAVVDDTGKLLGYTTIYPEFNRDDSPKSIKARKDLAEMIQKFKVEYLAIGNGTGSREIGRLIAKALKDADIKGVKRLTVNESGASVYSTDPVAREEFPDLDATIRSAISIARRLQDPLAELVKIDPRSIGVGQYQHDVNVTKLSRSLTEVVESCVNRVGVNINTASYSLLSYVSGISKILAKNMVQFRDAHGKFTSRSELLEVNGLGPKIFEQAAGFLRIPEGQNPLDNSGVHPESYEIIEQLAKEQSKSLKDLVGNRALIESVPWEKYVTAKVGMHTLKDIAAELLKPGRDPREDGARLTYSDEVCEMEDLTIGMKLKGTVTNVTNFGAFVDIGVHQDGLVHISELSDKFISDPGKAVAVGDVVDVRVIDVDLKRRRINLSCRLNPPTDERRPPARSDSGGDNRRPRGEAGNGDNRGHDGNGRERDGNQREQREGNQRDRSQDTRDNRARGGDNRRGGGDNRGRGGQNASKPAPQPKYTVEDLLAKFNQRK